MHISLRFLIQLLQCIAIAAFALSFTLPRPPQNRTLPLSLATESGIDTPQASANDDNPFPDGIDVPIMNTRLILRITEVGSEFRPKDVEEVVSAALPRVISKINGGRGKEKIDGGKFYQISPYVEMKINALQGAVFTWSMLGDVISGIWYYMNLPWSSFREVVFDVLFQGAEDWDYIGHGRLAVFDGAVAKIGNASLATDA